MLDEKKNGSRTTAFDECLTVSCERRMSRKNRRTQTVFKIQKGGFRRPCASSVCVSTENKSSVPSGSLTVSKIPENFNAETKKQQKHCPTASLSFSYTRKRRIITQICQHTARILSQNCTSSPLAHKRKSDTLRN